MTIFCFDFFVGNDAAFGRIDQEHAAGLEAAFLENAIRRDIEDTDFGSHDDQIILGDVVAGRTQTVAIENRADDACHR